MNLRNGIGFLSERHKRNYLDILSRYPDKCTDEYKIIFKLLALDEVYSIVLCYINTTTIDFLEMFRDERLSGKGLCICKVAYSLFSEYYQMNLNSITRLNPKERGYVLNCIYNYECIGNKSIRNEKGA